MAVAGAVVVKALVGGMARRHFVGKSRFGPSSAMTYMGNLLGWLETRLAQITLNYLSVLMFKVSYVVLMKFIVF